MIAPEQRHTQVVALRGIRVPCPGCSGERGDGNGNLLVHDENYPSDLPQRMICCHCQGNMSVLAEAPSG